MAGNIRLLGRTLVVVAAFLGSMLVGVLPTASAVTSHRPLNTTRPVGAGPVTVAFPIEYFGVVADLPTVHSHLKDAGPAPYGQARFRVDGRWTPWQDLDQDGAQAPGHFTGALVSVDHADAYQVRGLPSGAHGWRAAAINTTDGPPVVVGQRVVNTAHAGATCRSRADWGADESISGWATGSTQTYSPVQALTVHHTAGSNSLAQDYSATMRAIYSYHVQTNGWADIGYQYLIDGFGTVYEGRNAGHVSRSCLSGAGDGTDFAHQSGTDDLVTGAHVSNMNSGNLGIAMMGCFESSSACSGATTPTAGAIDGLEGLLASLSTRHHLNPTGTIHYVNPTSGAVRDLATISAHRDWLATDCPGGNLYAQLPAIRSNVATRTTPSAGTVPGAPNSVTAAASGSTATVSWAPPSTDGSSAVTSYQAFRGTSSTVSTTNPPAYTGTATQTTDTPSAGTYWYAVRACNAAGCGATTTAGPVNVTAPASPVRITAASCTGPTCTFSGTGAGTLRWTFGTGVTATGSPVKATYPRAGAYTTTVTDSQTPSTQATRAVTCTLVKRALRCTT